MTDGQTQINSRWLIYADALHLASNIMAIWFLLGPAVGAAAYALGLEVGDSIGLATFVSIFGTSVALEWRSRKVRRVVRARAARNRESVVGARI